MFRVLIIQARRQIMISLGPKVFICTIVAGLLLAVDTPNAQADDYSRQLRHVSQTDVKRETQTNSDQKRKKMLDRVNAQRKARGCPPLRENPKLDQAAQAQADAMQKNDSLVIRGLKATRLISAPVKRAIITAIWPKT